MGTNESSEKKRKEAVKEFLHTSYGRMYSHAMCHYSAASKYGAYRMRLGMPSVILCAIAGAGVGIDAPTMLDIADSDMSTPSLIIRLFMIFIVITSGILTSLMTFFDFEGLKNKHHETGKNYSLLLRKIETFKIKESGGMDPEEIEHELEEISNEEQKISIQAPPISDKTYQKVHSIINGEREGNESLPDPLSRFKHLNK